ncbi:hypothetical protein IPC730_10405 [Pseudomonas aeruginosa]|nr:hypothetical protein IPC730_10405 [Pseudomonas aeruginosa]
MLIDSIGDLTPGLTFLVGNLDAVVDPDSQQPALFGKKHFDAFLELTWSTSRNSLHQICQFVLAALELFI